MSENPENNETTEDPAVEGAPEQAADEAVAAEGATDAPAADAADEAPAAAEPEVQLTPKERRARRRGAAVAKRGPRRASTPEARAEERARKAAQRRAYRARLKARKAETPTQEPPTAEAVEKTGHLKLRQGVVTSNKADKTITVRIDVVRRHRRYHKTIRSSASLHAHDERNEANIGDVVRVVESRPLSRTKRWRLVEVVERAR